MAFASVKPICKLVKFLQDHTGIFINLYQKLLNATNLLTQYIWVPFSYKLVSFPPRNSFNVEFF